MSIAGTGGILNNFQTGIGILSQMGKSVDFTGFNNITGATPSFENCFAGIKLENGVSCNVEETSFRKNVRGIWVTQTGFYICFIKKSNFEIGKTGWHGILAETDGSGQWFSVDNSVFTQTGTGLNHGIEFNGGGGSVPSQLWLHEDNHFILNGDKVGIKIDNVNGSNGLVEIIDQTFIMTELNGAVPTAAKITNCITMSLQHNEVNSNTTTTAAKGFLFEESTNMCIRVNQFLDKLGPAVRFNDTCTSSKLNCNTFCGDQTSLLVNGVIDPHNHKSNTFFGTTLVQNNSMSFNQMKFKVDVIAYANYMPSSVSPQTWFVDVDDNGTSLGCTGVCGYPGSASICEPLALSALELAIADGGLFGAQTEPVQIWNAQRTLYLKLLENPSLIVSGSAVQSFYNGQSSTAVGAFAQVEKAIYDLLKIAAIDKQAFEVWHHELSDKMDELSALMEQLSQLADPTSNPTLLAAIADIESDITDINNAIVSLGNSIRSNQIAGVAAIVSMNNSLPASTDYQLYEKQVNEIILIKIASGSGDLTPTQLATLQSIASRCPENAGSSVYQATELLPWCDQKEKEATRGANCTGIGLRSKGSVVETEDLGFTIYPNPADEVLRIRLSSNKFETGTITLTNTLGQLVYVSNIGFGDREITVPTTQIQSGIYAFSLSQNGRLAQVQLVAISH